MAANAVFSTVELLEFILQENLVQDLVNAYKVCKTWRETIDDSVKLRRPLFRSALGGEVAIYKGGDLHYGGKDPGHWEHNSFTLSKPTFVLNPFLRRFLSTKDKTYFYGEAAKCIVFTPTMKHFSFKQCKLAGNSWRDLRKSRLPDTLHQGARA